MEKKIAPSEQKAQALRALLNGQAEGESGSDFRLRRKARQMGVGTREFLRFAKLSACDRSRA